ncbi:DUF4870 domain-containing protein [Nesterenkonia sp. HG001]|uniref:DUF4870 domain-containing protein n=1 Tax=Nesterenkonia sp. HG001 TaxID=2983207 RepID=UPI002AC7619D|nr:DUF4870 domain-containing protein [Nesterenkonia sp. HG001]MDZ5076341.1 DUF4870 domain-containing protein [Nesterenkonia sp. HG001]
MTQQPIGQGPEPFDPNNPQQPPQPVGGAQPSVQALSPGEEQGWGVAVHLGGVFLSWLVPLVVWLVFRERSRLIDDHGKEALNFQITLFIGYVISVVLMFVLVGILLWIALWICAIIFGIMASMAAYNRRPYRYPISIRFIK